MKNEYYEYIKREIGSLDKMTISQFGIALKGLVGKSEHDQCLTWDIKAMALANHFSVLLIIITCFDWIANKEIEIQN